jgi:ATP-binding cassette, subfamily B, bacterial
MEKQDKKKQLATAGEVFRAYYMYVRRYPSYFALIVLGGVMLQGAHLAAPLFLRGFFNTIASSAPNVALEPVLVGFLILTGLTYFMEWLGRRIQNGANSRMQSYIMGDLRVDAFSHLLGHSHNFFISRFVGSLTHKVSKYSGAFETLFDSIVVSFAPTLFFVLGAITILSFRSPLLGLILLGWTVLFVLFQIYISRLQQPLRTERAEADTQVTGALSDAISNQSAISLFASNTYEIKRLSGVVEKWSKLNLRTWIADEWTWAGVGLLMMVIEIGLLFVAMKLWIQGVVTVGDFVLIQAYLLTTFDRLVSINRELRRFYSSFTDASEMVHILNMPHEVADVSKAKKLKITLGEVWFENVSFHFNKDTNILDTFNLKIAGGERIALVGPSGAGKSTITKLLLRLFDLKEGQIKVDRQNIAKITQTSLREAISFVPQEPVLFHRTLMDNIRYGRRDATDDEVIEAAKKAHCHEFIDALPDKYNTFVGERGVKLSGGERQRVAIARAILKNAPILILDEATSSLDSESEKLIQDALEVLMQGKTVIVIAHRLSTIMKMDRIVVLEKGTVVADGTHQELLNQNGLYAKLWSIQAGGFIADDGSGVEKVEEEELEEFAKE